MTITLIKLAILILYLRTFATRLLRRAVWIVGAIVIANATGIFVSVCTYCTPIAHFCDPRGVPGHCINEVVAATLYSLTLMVPDLIIYVMPVPVKWKLRMTTPRKMETILVLTEPFLTAATVSVSRE